MKATGDQLVYLNQQFLPRSEAALDIEDRGALFADGVYEVVRYYAGCPFAMGQHTARLRASLAAIHLAEPPDVEQLGAISSELITRNGLTDADVYWQITRGSEPRKHAYSEGLAPTVLAIAYRQPPLVAGTPVASIRAVLAEDERWHRCDIKSLMGLPNVLAIHQALRNGADEAIFHRNHRVTEGTATSLFMVHHKKLWTAPADQWILDGITRRTILELSRKAGIPTFERPFTTDRLLSADEAIVCSTTKSVTAVVAINGKSIGSGTVGPVTGRLMDLYTEHILQACSP